ncbi:MAG: maltose O-acetyltransferase, partial [Spirochaetes bacterium]|nr:maltose O-acetyltransferase [Spirochaetota bacterium]
MKKSEKEKMISGELYNAFCSELIMDRECANVLFTELNTIGKATQKKREDI